MPPLSLRQKIAVEAARLLHQRKESDLRAARRKAARWLSRERLSREELPTAAEIQHELLARIGQAASREQLTRLEVLLATADLLQLLEDWQPRASGETLQGIILPGVMVEIALTTSPEDTLEVSATEQQQILEGIVPLLHDAGYAPVARRDEREQLTSVLCHERLSAQIHWNPSASDDPAWLDHDAVLAEWSAVPLAIDAELKSDTDSESVDDEGDDSSEGYSAETLATFRTLLLELERVAVDPQLHPEGDLLYHSLQVFELSAEAYPYDEEFQLAALLHDIGEGLDRREPLEAAWQAIGDLITERTWFLIAGRMEASAYLSTGKIRGSLRRSPDFEQLLQLARFDLAGRVRGAIVRDVDEALEHIAGLSTEWDSE